jgi:hypothetical protein
MGKKWPIQFCRQHATSTVNVGIFYMPQIYDMGQMDLLPLRKKGMLRIFSPETSDGCSRVWTREIGYQRFAKIMAVCFKNRNRYIHTIHGHNEEFNIKALILSGHFMYYRPKHTKIYKLWPHSIFMCSVWISEHNTALTLSTCLHFFVFLCLSAYFSVLPSITLLQILS